VSLGTGVLLWLFFFSFQGLILSVSFLPPNVLLPVPTTLSGLSVVSLFFPSFFPFFLFVLLGFYFIFFTPSLAKNFPFLFCFPWDHEVTGCLIKG